MQGGLITQILLPLVLFVVMLAMGLSLEPRDFRRVGLVPRALLTGLAAQLLLLPLLGFALVSLFELSPALAVGLMILTFCPGGTASNLLSYLAGGDLALSITLTAVVSMITPFTIPLLTNLAMVHWFGDATQLRLPAAQTIGALLVLTVLPVGLGMLARARWPKLAERTERAAKIGAGLCLVLITAVIVVAQWQQLPGWFVAVGPVCALLALLATALGYAAGATARLERGQSITVAIEVGVQNGATALFVTGTLLDSAQMTISPVIYTLSILIIATGFAWVARSPWRSAASG